jgi:hypothetical protein
MTQAMDSRIGDKVCIKGRFKLMAANHHIYSLENAEILENPVAKKRAERRLELAKIPIPSDKANARLWKELLVLGFDVDSTRQFKKIGPEAFFSKTVNELEGKKIVISGYYMKEVLSDREIITGIKREPKPLLGDNFYNVLTLDFDRLITFYLDDETIENNDKITVQGVFSVNRDNPWDFIYRLEKVEILNIEKYED